MPLLDNALILVQPTLSARCHTMQAQTLEYSCARYACEDNDRSTQLSWTQKLAASNTESVAVYIHIYHCEVLSYNAWFYMHVIRPCLNVNLSQKPNENCKSNTEETMSCQGNKEGALKSIAT